MISIAGAVNTVITLVVVGLVFWLLSFMIAKINPPEPYRKIADVVIIVLAVMVLIGILLSFVGYGPVFRP